ncbi:MAG: sensor histidine kinase [Gemmatimonadaceae bacterium]
MRQPSLRQPPFSRRELTLIGAFWFAYAFLVVANRIVGPLARSEAFDVHWRVLAVTFLEYGCWALFTPLIFWLASRGEAEDSRSRQLALLVATGVAVAIVMSMVAYALREALLVPSPPQGSRNGLLLPPRGPRIDRALARELWFGFISALVISVGLLAAGIARAYSMRYRERREHAARLQAQLADARLDALRRQLDPHFLFNTLNAISSLVERDPRGVRRMIARLSDLLRFSLDGANKPEIALRDELAMLDRYLDIVRVRFGDRLEIETKIDDRTLDVMVPSLILQPLVENAIRHGVEKLRGQGRLVVESVLDGGSVVLRVRDNGPHGENGASSGAPPGVTLGVAAGAPAGAPSGIPLGGAPGVGIRNTVARLTQLYGEAGSFTLRTLDGSGTEAEVRVPARGLA